MGLCAIHRAQWYSGRVACIVAVVAWLMYVLHALHGVLRLLGMEQHLESCMHDLQCISAHVVEQKMVAKHPVG